MIIHRRKTELPDPEVATRGLNSDDRKFHLWEYGLESNGSDGEVMLAQTRYKATTLWHLGYHDNMAMKVKPCLAGTWAECNGGIHMLVLIIIIK